MTLKHALLATMIMTATPGLAQSTPPTPEMPAPHADPGMVNQPRAGVVTPPKIDPGMMAPAPQAGTGIVIAPPGTAHNNPTVIPK